MTLLFTYGTLKFGFAAHHLLGSAKLIDEATTHPRYHLVNLGWFPAMIEDTSKEGGVKGELYEVSDKLFESLDYYEGVRSGLFIQAEIDLSDGRKVIAYLFKAKIEGCKVIEGGVWE